MASCWRRASSTIACSFRLRKKAGRQRRRSVVKRSRACMTKVILHEVPAEYETDSGRGSGVLSAVDRSSGERGKGQEFHGRRILRTHRRAGPVAAATRTPTRRFGLLGVARLTGARDAGLGGELGARVGDERGPLRIRSERRVVHRADEGLGAGQHDQGPEGSTVRPMRPRKPSRVPRRIAAARAPSPLSR